MEEKQRLGYEQFPFRLLIFPPTNIIRVFKMIMNRQALHSLLKDIQDPSLAHRTADEIEYRSKDPRFFFSLHAAVKDPQLPST